MHAFITALPEYHAIAGLSRAANTALVVCGYHPGKGWYYGMVSGAPALLSSKPDLRRDELTLNELLRWLEGLRIGLPAGLSVQLRRDVPNGINPGQGVNVGPNPAARELAYARLLQLLQQAFTP